MAKVWEVVVERKVTNTFTVDARSGAEAAAVVGMALAGDRPWENSVEVESSRRLLAPKLATGATARDEPAGFDFDAMRRGETPAETPAGDEIASAMAQRAEDTLRGKR